MCEFLKFVLGVFGCVAMFYAFKNNSDTWQGVCLFAFGVWYALSAFNGRFVVLKMIAAAIGIAESLKTLIPIIN